MNVVTYFQSDAETYFFSNGQVNCFIPAEFFELFVELLVALSACVKVRWLS